MDKCAKTYADVWHSDVWCDSFKCARHATSPAILSECVLNRNVSQISPDDRTAATHCNSLQHNATHRNTLQHCRRRRCHQATRRPHNTPQHTATHRNTPQHTRTHNNTQHRRPCRCQHVTWWSQYTATHATHRNTLQHHRPRRCHQATRRPQQPRQRVQQQDQPTRYLPTRSSNGLPTADTPLTTVDVATWSQSDILHMCVYIKKLLYMYVYGTHAIYRLLFNDWGRCQLILKRCPICVCVHLKKNYYVYIYV